MSPLLFQNIRRIIMPCLIFRLDVLPGSDIVRTLESAKNIARINDVVVSVSINGVKFMITKDTNITQSLDDLGWT